jgi:hypothetical protein
VNSLSPEQFERLLPLAVTWAKEQERNILARGERLSPSETSDASLAGVSHPERVRLMRVARIPMPEHPDLQAAGHASGLISADTKGLTLGYGIFIHGGSWRDRSLIVHELVHTAQYERLGGFTSFLSQYLFEFLTVGYPAAPLEQEAMLRAADILGSAYSRT